MTPWLAFGLSLVAVAIAAILLIRRIDARMRQDVALDEIKREVGGIITELNQTAERNISLIEDRIAKLEELTERADRRIGALQGLSDRDRVTQRTYSYLKPGPGAIVPEESAPVPRGDVDESLDPIHLNLTSPEQLVATAPPAKVPFSQQVLQLRREGLSPRAIASRLGTTVGEVDLVISLDEG